MANAIKAVGLLSGGLDSTLALKLLKDQSIEILAVHIMLPFADDKKDYVTDIAHQLGIPLIKIWSDEEYIELVRHPRHSRGSGMNPCIDCRIYMLRKAWETAQQVGAQFLVTGDVLGQRPMTQHLRELKIEEREAGLEGLILRPLSAKLLPKTVAEEKGWVDRECLLAIQGRSRRQQLALAQQYGIQGYRTPSGGCLLTKQEFSFRLRELFRRQSTVTRNDIELLKLGRHFFLADAHIIVGRNENENHRLLELKDPQDEVFQLTDYPGPVTILRGAKTEESMKFAIELTERYSKKGRLRSSLGEGIFANSRVSSSIEEECSQ